ncbi:MAG: type II toxin-antitoxin system VapC family toxin [Terracoccus sp.]
MKTLYLRNVPDDVVRRLQLLADRDGTSVSAVAVRELSDVSRRADNPALMGSLPDLGVDALTIVEGIEHERATVIVLDASAALPALLNAGPARDSLAREQLHAPHLIDSEVASGLRRHVASGRISADAGWVALDAWCRLAVTRYATHGLLERVWALRDHLSAYDAGYVALAESLDCALLTADARISRAPRLRCPITVVPR